MKRLLLLLFTIATATVTDIDGNEILQIINNGDWDSPSTGHLRKL